MILPFLQICRNTLQESSKIQINDETLFVDGWVLFFGNKRLVYAIPNNE